MSLPTLCPTCGGLLVRYADGERRWLGCVRQSECGWRFYLDYPIIGGTPKTSDRETGKAREEKEE